MVRVWLVLYYVVRVCWVLYLVVRVWWAADRYTGHPWVTRCHLAALLSTMSWSSTHHDDHYDDHDDHHGDHDDHYDYI